MAAEHLKSGSITNRDASPRALNNPAHVAGMLKGFVGRIVSGGAGDIGSTYRFGQIPSNALVHTLRVYADDIGSAAAAMDFGLYKNTEDGGAVVDADFFASAVSLKDGALNGTDITHEATQFPLSKAEQPLWQALGLSADPKLVYDVVGTATGAIDEAENVVLKCVYSV